VLVVDDFRGKPILRWAGGKQSLVAELLRALPESIDTLNYFEPFLGAGSLFIATRPKRARLSDLNGHLIDAYKAIRDSPEGVAELALAHAKRDSESYYYAVRTLYNQAEPSAERAAQFIYLNRACFNGVFRVNRQGAYNVPYGHKPRLLMPSALALKELATAFHTASLSVSTYQQALREASAGDFVYLDPPYPPLNGTAFFTHYTKERFGVADQEELAALASDLRARGCLVLVSNADTQTIRSLYAGWAMKAIRVARSVGHHGRPTGELLITSYPTRAARES
jgi:DNA adenine methylase